MPRGFHRDISATKAAHFADKRSFVSTEKHTHGDKAVGHLLLYGADVAAARGRAIFRATDKDDGFFRCQYPVGKSGEMICGDFISDYLPEWHQDKAHMRHILDKPWNRCFCDENLEMVSGSHHALDHPDGRLGKAKV